MDSCAVSQVTSGGKMTLAPLDNRHVRSVPSERYPLNKTCSSPVSDPGTPATEPHHCFRRSAIGGDSWFVEITEEGGQITLPIPHVTGLSHEAHRQVTEHEAWIRLEDGIWNWYERQTPCVDERDTGQPTWILVGPLNPQPGSVESKPKRARHKGEAKRKRKTISIRVPEGYEASTYDEKLEQASEITQKLMGVEYDIYPFIVLDAALQEFIEMYRDQLERVG